MLTGAELRLRQPRPGTLGYPASGMAVWGEFLYHLGMCFQLWIGMDLTWVTAHSTMRF